MHSSFIMKSCLFLFLCIIGASFAAQWRANPPPKPQEFAHKEGCYIKEINDVIPYGEKVMPIGYCYRVQCGSKLMTYSSCGSVGAGQGCYVTKEDLTKPYPECCPKIKCDKNNKIEAN